MESNINLMITDDQRLVIENIKLGKILTDKDYEVIFNDLISNFGKGYIDDELPRKLESYLLSRYFSDFDRKSFINKYNKYVRNA